MAPSAPPVRGRSALNRSRTVTRRGGRTVTAVAVLAVVGAVFNVRAAPTLVDPGADLQQALGRTHAIRLRPDSDYSGRSGTLRLSSGQSIEVGWNSRLPVIEIPAGTHDIELIGVRGESRRAADVIFSGGSAVSRDIRIVGAAPGAGNHPKIRIAADSRIERLRLYNYGGLEVLQSRSGYVRDSVFSRMVGYRPGPLVDWIGNNQERSWGNSFLGISAITPARGARWVRAGNLWLFGLDCESWNGGGRGWPTCFEVRDSDRVVSIALSGGADGRGASGALAEFRRVGDLLTWYQSGHGGSTAPADIVFEDIGQLTTLQRHIGTTESVVRSVNRTDLLPIPKVEHRTDPSVSRDDMRRLDDWSRVSLPSFGAHPQERIASRVQGRETDGDWIQAAIDEHGVAQIPPGRYLLHRSLRVGSALRPEGLVGAGSGLTELVAAGQFPILMGRGDVGRGVNAFAVPTMIRWVLTGMRLTGGTLGVHWSGEYGNAGPGAQIAYSEFTDLDFSGQSDAAVGVDGIFGLDNNVWRAVVLRDVPVGIRGRGRGTGPGMNYADKQYFLDSQFINVRGAVWDWVADRPSGGNTWQDSFFGHVGGLSHTRAALGLAWINSTFEDVGPSTAISLDDNDGKTRTAYFFLLGCEFRGDGPSVVTDTPSDIAGTLTVATDFRQRHGSLVPTSGHQGLSVWGARVYGPVGVGNLEDALILGSSVKSALAETTVFSSGRRVNAMRDD